MSFHASKVVGQTPDGHGLLIANQVRQVCARLKFERQPLKDFEPFLG